MSKTLILGRIQKGSKDFSGKGKTQKAPGVSMGGVKIWEAPALYQEDDDYQQGPGIHLGDDVSQEILQIKDTDAREEESVEDTKGPAN